MGEPALEGIGDHVEAVAAREGLDQKLVGARQHRTVALDPQPVGDLVGERRPFFRVGEDGAHAGREEGGERELAAGIDRDLRRVVGGAGGHHLVLENALEAQDQAGEEEGVAGRQRLDEILLILPSTRPPRPAKPAPRLRETRRSRAPSRRWCRRSSDCWATRGWVMRQAVHQVADPVEAVIRLQRIAAGATKSTTRSRVCPFEMIDREPEVTLL